MNTPLSPVRWLQRADGSLVLQQLVVQRWVDVPVVSAVLPSEEPEEGVEAAE